MAAKRVKVLDGRAESSEESECKPMDRISKLPDYVIHHILSFLPTIVERSLYALHHADSSITRFTLAMSFGGAKTLVNKLLNFVVKNKVEELDLCISPWYHNGGHLYYCLPDAVLNARSLTLLKLDGLKINDLLARCPSLETMVLRTCADLSTSHVSSSTLKHFEV
ncbi:hypothetical protein TIFTF001_004041 [Ficus carica]|uniref:Uncharacterized protein n=1 Tax=Ficus carica TaxID=3494 RepID=A0AA87ZU28_FICCA|nr:hypothetical protein TIFTF001_004041 [Ficus carica]